MTVTRRKNQILQELVIHGFNHDAPGQDALSGVAATGTLTCDTKANSTDLDYFLINDGQSKAMLWYNVSGTQVARFARVSAPAIATLTCDTLANTANEGYVSIYDGRNTWDIMMDTDASGDSTGNAHVVVDVSGAVTAADIVALIVADVNAQAASATLDTPEETFHIKASASGNDVIFTSTIDGYDGNGACSVTTLANAWAVTNMIGGVDAFPADEFAECDISAAVTAADVAAVVHGVINALTEVRYITSTDNADGTLTLTNDEEGAHGNTAQDYSETGTTLMDLTDMAGGANVDGTGATAATKLFSAQRKMRIDKVEYINPTGLAGHAANYWDIGIKIGATIAAEWSTDSAAEGTLTANAVNEMTLSSTDANLIADADDVISFYATKVASAANLPAGRAVIHARYL